MPTLANDQATARLSTLLQKDAMRMQVLTIVRELALSDCYVAAGFIRNLVWDDLHTCETALSDIDVV
ncbi:MAG: nucleotidyltransferase family protein, partial [Pseudomonadales bacterium]|nr:nucleotidyltransferase family protein [Pseudomonadales bacterium]